ncbi:hypothetical protein [Silvibacterium acidisoli]|uniref:hypothetical protein n=1 Tax=Acidobacteriaceae bacterium ZG23-2 TaxID=2883246 RepID=UPI00406D4535
MLMITGIAGAENCAAVLAKQFNMTVETAADRQEGLAALLRKSFTLVVIDDSLIEPSNEGGDVLLRNAGLAIPLEINFAISGCGRLVREVRSALHRRTHEQSVAAKAVAASMQSDMRDMITGLVLHAQLALGDPAVSPQLAEKLRTISDLAGKLRGKLDQPPSLPAAMHARQGIPPVHIV